MSYERFRTPSADTINPTTTNRRPSPSSHNTVLNFDQEDDSESNQVREALLRESGHISRSEQMLDEQFEVAVKTRETLVNQRWTIKSMQTQYDSISQRFLTIGSLIRKIRVRKLRDTIIVAIVFCICLFLLLYNIL